MLCDEWEEEELAIELAYKAGSDCFDRDSDSARHGRNHFRFMACEQTH